MDDSRHATCNIFIDKMVLDTAYHPAQVIGGQVIGALKEFFDSKPDYDRLTVNLEVAYTQPLPISAPTCDHDDVIFDRHFWHCNVCGESGQR